MSVRLMKVVAASLFFAFAMSSITLAQTPGTAPAKATTAPGLPGLASEADPIDEDAQRAIDKEFNDTAAAQQSDTFDNSAADAKDSKKKSKKSSGASGAIAQFATGLAQGVASNAMQMNSKPDTQSQSADRAVQLAKNPAAPAVSAGLAASGALPAARSIAEQNIQDKYADINREAEQRSQRIDSQQKSLTGKKTDWYVSHFKDNPNDPAFKDAPKPRVMPDGSTDTEYENRLKQWAAGRAAGDANNELKDDRAQVLDEAAAQTSKIAQVEAAQKTLDKSENDALDKKINDFAQARNGAFGVYENSNRDGNAANDPNLAQSQLRATIDAGVKMGYLKTDGSDNLQGLNISRNISDGPGDSYGAVAWMEGSPSTGSPKTNQEISNMNDILQNRILDRIQNGVHDEYSQEKNTLQETAEALKAKAAEDKKKADALKGGSADVVAANAAAAAASMKAGASAAGANNFLCEGDGSGNCTLTVSKNGQTSKVDVQTQLQKINGELKELQKSYAHLAAVRKKDGADAQRDIKFTIQHINATKNNINWENESLFQTASTDEGVYYYALNTRESVQSIYENMNETNEAKYKLGNDIPSIYKAAEANGYTARDAATTTKVANAFGPTAKSVVQSVGDFSSSVTAMAKNSPITGWVGMFGGNAKSTNTNINIAVAANGSATAESSSGTATDNDIFFK